MQPWIHDDSMSNSTSASLPLTTVERSPQRERRASQGSSSRDSRALSLGMLKIHLLCHYGRVWRHLKPSDASHWKIT